MAEDTVGAQIQLSTDASVMGSSGTTPADADVQTVQATLVDQVSAHLCTTVKHSRYRAIRGHDGTVCSQASHEERMSWLQNQMEVATITV